MVCFIDLHRDRRVEAPGLILHHGPGALADRGGDGLQPIFRAPFADGLGARVMLATFPFQRGLDSLNFRRSNNNSRKSRQG
jgi:hypothetical protein